MTFEPTAEDHARAVRLAHDAVVADIEACHTVTEGGLRWYDTRPMTDPRENPPEFVDMATDALAHADAWKLIHRHPTQPHLVRVAAR